MTIASNLSFLQNSAGAITTGTVNAIGSPITFSVNNTEYNRIDTNGYSLLGYTTSQGSYKLQVNGNVLINGTLSLTTASIGNITGSVTTASNIAGGTTGQLHYQTGVGLTGFVGPGTSGQLLVSAGASAPVYTNTASIYVNSARYADNITAGTTGQLVYQSAANTTGFVGPGTSGQLLVSAGASAPVYTTTSSIQVGYSANILAGTTGQLVYQSAANTTGFVGPGTAGQFLQSAGASAPTYVSTTTMYVQRAVQADSAVGASGSTTGALTAGTGLTSSGGTFNGSTNITFSLNTATLMASAVQVTSSLSAGTGLSGSTFNGSTAQTWTLNTATLMASSVNIAGGTTGQLVYQSAANTTGFVGPGTAGQFLQSAGAGAPTYVNTGTMYVQRAVLADSVTGSAGSSSQVQTQAQPANASYYPVFVSANNASATAMSEYTTSSFVINPSTGYLGLGASSPSQQLEVNGNAFINVASGNPFLQIKTGGAGNNPYIRTQASSNYWDLQSTFSATNTPFYTMYNGTVLTSLLNTGNFGIGTTTPQAKLAVSSAGAEGIEFFPAASSGVNTTQHYNRSGSSYVRNRTIASDYTFNLSGAGTDAMSLTSAGILLIAGTTTYSNAKIQLVNGDVSSGSSNLSQIAFQYGSGGYTHYVQSRHDSLGTTDGNALVFNLNTGTTAGVSSAFGTGNAQSYFMGYLTHRWNTSATERLRLTANGGVSFGASGTAYGSSGQVLQSNGDAPPSWVSPSSLAAASSTQVSTQAQSASGTYYPVFVSANNASATAMSEYTTSSFFINPSTGFATVGGGGGSIAPLNVSSLAVLGGTAGNYIPVFTQQATGGSGGNNVYETTWRYRGSAGTDWTTQRTHNGIWVDASFTVPGSSTRCWWERDPNAVTQAWGNGATTFKFLDSSGNMFLTGGSAQLNTGFTNKLNVSGGIVAGSATSTNGSIILQGQYGTGAITVLGTEYSSGGPVLGYGVYPSNAAAGAFFSSSGLALTRAAYTQAGNVHNWYVGASQTVAIGGAATLSNVMSLNSSGQLMIGSGTAGAPLSFTDSLATKIQYNGNNANGYTVGLASAVNSGDAMMKFVAGATGAGEFGFYNTTNLRLLINNSGNVGINNSSPSYRLDVTGSLRSSAVALLGSSVGQGDPSSTDVTANATLLLSGVGGNYLSFGQKASNLCQWIQSAYSNPTTAVYPISLNPLGGSVGIGNLAPAQALHVTGQIIATSEITAYYSDRRLKENVKPVDNAIEKVLSLNGITYTPNELAESFGFERNTDVVGLFADEVEAVLPQAVKLAPFDQTAEGVSKSGENYKTIQYEKLVPLLVEAIKEQQQQITQLQELVNQLVNK